MPSTEKLRRTAATRKSPSPQPTSSRRPAAMPVARSLPQEPHWTQNEAQPAPAESPPPAATDVPGPRQIMRRLYAMAFDDASVEAADASPRAQHAEIVAATVETLPPMLLAVAVLAYPEPSARDPVCVVSSSL